MIVDEEKEKICNKDSFKKLVIKYQESDSSDYALMLDGLWGAGKTYYIQHFIKDLSDYYKDYNFFYYSLNGLKDINTVITNIFLKLVFKFNKKSSIVKLLQPINKLINYFTSLINNKKARIVIDSLSTISEDINYFIINSTLKKENKLNKTIIFLDDLERISDTLDITDLLGNLHNCFLDNKIKIVYITDESKIFNNESYNKEKEKYIKRTYKFIVNKHEVFNNLLNKQVFNNLNKKILFNSMLDAFPEVQPNLRTVKYACDVFEEIIFTYESFPKNAKYTSVELLFYSVCCYSKLYADGNTNKKELLDALHYSNMRRCMDKDSNENAYEKFVDNCILSTNNLLIVESIIDFIFDGLLNPDKLLYEVICKEETSEPLLELTSNLYKLETSELKEFINQIIQNLRQKKYTIRDLARLQETFSPYCKKLKILNESEIASLIIDSIFDDSNSEELNNLFIYMQKDESVKLPSYNTDFNIKISNLYNNFKSEAKNNYIQQAFKALTNCTYDDEFFINREDLFLFSELEKSNKLKDLIDVQNKVVYFIISIISKNILRCGNPDYYKSELVPLENLLKYSDEEIELLNSKESDDFLRIKALQDLSKIIKEAIKHIKDFIH